MSIKPVKPPVRVNQIPRQIPPSTNYLRPLPSMVLAGILPFGAIFVELYFIMQNMWFGKVYYMFGFLFICYGIMIITCAAVTILLVYFLLCSENYHWQWRAFATAGASAGYVFGNALLYWMGKLSFGSFTSGVLYIGYSALISFLFFILTGTILCLENKCHHMLILRYRNHRLLLKLGFRAQNLRFNQDRLSQFVLGIRSEGWECSISCCLSKRTEDS